MDGEGLEVLETLRHLWRGTAALVERSDETRGFTHFLVLSSIEFRWRSHICRYRVPRRAREAVYFE